MKGILSVLLLTAVYAATLASADPLDLAAGLVISTAVVVGLRRFLFRAGGPPAGDMLRRMAAFPRLALAVVVEITRGTWQVALVVLDRRRLVEPGIVAVPIGERTRTGVAATALAVTLSPGEVFVDVDWTRRLMLLHVIDARDPDAVRRHHAQFYERYQRAVFP